MSEVKLMFQGIKNYAKCVAENRFALGGYASITLASVLFYFEKDVSFLKIPGIIAAWGGVFSLAVTGFGTESFKAYRRTKKHIQQHGTLDKRFIHPFDDSYCTQKGRDLAAKEAGLEHLIHDL